MSSAQSRFEDIKILEDKLLGVQLPQELSIRAKAEIERLARVAGSAGFSQEYQQTLRYLDWAVSLPWNKSSQEILSIEHAKKTMEANHYGLVQVKERVMEYIAVASLKKAKGEKIKAPAFLLVGLVGTGKTTMAYSIAQALGRQFGRIPLGGMGDPLQLRGKSKFYPDSEPGQIIKVLRRVGVNNPVILLDELDRITEEAKADIMGVLVELLDPEQNSKFLDYFIDFPFDLSQVLFIATANNTSGIAQAVIDRLELIEMPSYADEEKIIIGKNYLFQRAMSASGLSASDLTIQEEVWPLIVRPLGFDAGTRTLDRTINGICRKVAKLKVQGTNPKVVLTKDNVRQYLPNW